MDTIVAGSEWSRVRAMEANCTKLTERILQLTLEIIYLLTGEDNIAVKKTLGDAKNSVMVPLLYLLIPERNNEQKILEVTKKMIELLTGEMGNGSSFDISIKEEIKAEEGESVMKEWEYIEGHNDLFKDIMMASQPALTSPDAPSNGKPPERCPSPLYSRNSTQEHHTIPYHDQRAEVIDIKTEIKGEETYVRGNPLSMKESDVMVTITKEKSSSDINTRGPNGWNKEDNVISLYSPGVNIATQNIHLKLNHMERSKDQFNFKSSRDETHTIIPNIQPSFSSTEKLPDPPNPEEFSLNNFHSSWDRKKSFIGKHDPFAPQRIHTSKKSFLCSECGKSFRKKSHLVEHLRIHTGEKPFSCPECDKSFKKKSHIVEHLRIHTSEKPFSCTVCGKSFIRKWNLVVHQRIHSNNKHFLCSACGKS